jgi:hypothetical protein
LFFFKLLNKKWISFKTGDVYPFSTRQFVSRSFAFDLDPKKNSTYFLRVWNEGGAGEFELRLHTHKKFAEMTSKNNLGFGLFYGLVMAMIFYNFFIFLSTGSKSYLFYVFFFGAWNLMLNGFAQRFIFSHSIWLSDRLHWVNNRGSLFVMGLLIISISFFTLYFLKLRESSPKKNILVWILIGSSSFLLLSSFLFSHSFNGYFTHYNSIFLMLVLFICGIDCVRMKYRPAKYYLLAFSCVICGGTIYTLIGMGILPGSFFTSQSIIIGSSLELILLSMGLADRFNYEKELAAEKEKSLQREVIEKNLKLVTL